MNVGVFAEGRRPSDLTSAEHGEPISEHLERSTRPQFAATRTWINDWFRNLCPVMRPGVRYRLTSRSNDELAAGHWELYLHELLIRLGYDVAFEPALSTDRRVDFFVSRGGASFYLEATVAHSSRDERSADAHRNRIYRELQRVRTDQSMFGIEIQRAGPRDMPHAGICRQRVEEWLRGLDPDAVTIAREVALLAQLGVDPRDALAAATVVPREFLGDGREVADIVTYDDDPRDDPELLNRPAAVVVGSTRLK